MVKTIFVFGLGGLGINCKCITGSYSFENLSVVVFLSDMFLGGLDIRFMVYL